MIFEVKANQIEKLDESELVTLLRKLIQAELNKNGIPISSGTAPAQITIPDGGDDARVTWKGGPNETDWLPSRFTIFQCKKGKIFPADLKAETQTKSSQKSDSPVLNEALEKALEQSGAYIIVTATPVVGTNIDRRIKAIQEGISATGKDSFNLSSIKIYDCNKLTAWTNTHPSVALWLNSVQRDVHLGGFQTYEDWGLTPEIGQIQFQKSDEARFIAKGTEIQAWHKEDSTILDKKSFSQIKEILNTFFLKKGNTIRVIGPSGYGKTRFVHQLIEDEDANSKDFLDKNQIIYCIHEDVSERIINIARDIAVSGSRALLIVDDCPDSIHTRLNEIVHIDGSKCLLLTIGVETKAQGIRQNLIIELCAASDELIGNIATSINNEISNKNSKLIRDLSQGFPRMAVFASRALEDGDEEFSSVETLISRIIWGENDENQSAFESLQLLSLFTIVGMENNAIGELEEIASYREKSAQKIYQETRRFTERGVLSRHGDYAEVQPLPIAMCLANLWMESNPSGSLEALFRSLSDEMKLRLVGRLRWVSWSEKVTRFARSLLIEAFPDLSALDNEFKSKLLDRFVHLAPDETMEHLDTLFADKSIDELTKFSSGRRYVVWALEKLVFRRQTFISAAKLLLRLSAAENEDWGNNATGQFIGLFQLHLSGTEAPPEDKLFVLDEGLANTDERVRKVCVKSLNKMLTSGHFTRSGGQEHIGAGGALEDWRPQTYGQIFDYYRAALLRLEQIALNPDDPYDKEALESIGSHLRSLFAIVPLFDEIQEMISRIHQNYPQWKKPLLKVNEWLFFDRKDADEEHQERLRSYYNELLPKDAIDLLDFYSTGWSGDIHDPDVSYKLEGNNDHRYAERKINEIIVSCPNSAEHFFPILDQFLLEPKKSNGIATAVNITKHVTNPECLLSYLLEKNSEETEKNVIANLACNIIVGASQTERTKGLECLKLALGCHHLREFSVNFIAAAGLDDELMHRAIEFVQSDTVEPYRVLSISYGDILQDINPDLIEKMASTLLTKGGQGAWAVIDFLDRAIYRSDNEYGHLVEVLMQSVTNHALFGEERRSMTDWYHWCDMIEKLQDEGHLDEGHYVRLIDFIISVTEVTNYSVQLAFDEYAQRILRRLISHNPRLVWEKYHEAREMVDEMKVHRLDRLFGTDLGDPSTPGVLNEIPDNIYIPWMLEDKNTRMPFIMDWIKLFIYQDGEREWSPDFILFIDKQVDREDMLDALRTRLTTGGWIGSYANKLEKERGLLQQLKETSTNPYVLRWINQTISRMELQIKNERRRDENREASYRA